mmetsp:Transcript_24425/g.71401  ORF Transcript_24425/g.71401 Transcript_24425/m.71401 type:complete len:189 (-) Transcript_24425:264-830(-)
MGGADGTPIAKSAATNISLMGGQWRHTIVLADASLFSHSVVCRSNIEACCKWLHGDASGLIEAFLRTVRCCAAWACHLVLLFEGVIEGGASDDAEPPPMREQQRRADVVAAARELLVSKGGNSSPQLLAAAKADKEVRNAVLAGSICVEVLVARPGVENDHLGAMLCSQLIASGKPAAVLFRDGDMFT